jgi:hypothetical protein
VRDEGKVLRKKNPFDNHRKNIKQFVEMLQIKNEKYLMLENSEQQILMYHIKQRKKQRR